MKKIFIVTSGSYSDYGIEAVLSTKELAEKYISIFPNTSCDRSIEEYPLDLLEDQLKSGRKPFLVQMKKDGEVVTVRIEESASGFEEPPSFSYDKSWVNIYCFADDEKHAIKIANEKRGELIAMDIWGKSQS